ncbi:MAG: type II secretion system F family protein [Sporichthyaceae bacterium]
MTTAIVVFAALGAAVVGLLALLVPQRPGLLAAIGRLDAARTAVPTGVRPVDGPSWADRQAQLGRLLGDRLAPRLRPGRTPHDPAGRQCDLAITGRSDDLLMGRQVLTGLVGLLALPMLAVALAPAGARLPGAVLLIGSPILALAFGFLPQFALRKDAESKRAEFRRALSCYLDLVAMSMAGGRGAPQALSEAADLSDGWTHRLIADALATARLSGTNAWHGLGELGRRIGVPELCELAGALALVGDHGARVRDTLSARAATLRRRALTDAEGNAAQADQSMRIAQVLLALGFLILIAYPALAAVLAL